MRTHLTRLSAVLAAATLAVGMTGCTKTSYSCSGGKCEISLSGVGADTEVNGNTFKLVGIEGGTATVAVDGKDVTCEQGGNFPAFNNATATCTEVGEDSVKITVEG